MNNKIFDWLKTKYPQNYILKNPYIGTLIIVVFFWGFTVLYRPFNTHATGVFSYEATMAVYSFLSWIFILLIFKIITSFKWFSNRKDWTILKELFSDLIGLSVLGIAVYLLGFLIESGPSANRWNISTFLGSFKIGFMIGIIPVTFFTAINYRFLIWQNIEPGTKTDSENQPLENLIKITSQLKKEELNFYPSQFMYAESEGNYVIFYLIRNNVVKKEIIRNSIHSIEQQLSDIPYFIRIHRAFIVNLKKVRSKQGNTLGYQIKLSDIENKIPVSRTNTKIFNELLIRYH